MATKEDILSLKGKDRTFSSFCTDTKQYSNLNLNQTQKCSNSSSFVQSNSKSNIGKQFGSPKGHKYEGGGAKKSSSYHKSPFNGLKDSNNQAKKDFKNQEKKGSSKNNKNNSTLSLHIAAYENVIKASSKDSSNFDDSKTNKKDEKEKNAIKKWKNQKQSFIVNSTFDNINQSSYEYPRQQEEQNVTNPEVMQFKTSQKLANPKQSSSSYQHGTPSRKPSATLSPTQVKREAATLRFRELWELLPPSIPNRHPLHSRWVFWFLKGDRTKDWEDCLHQVTAFDSIEGFWSVANHFIQPSDLSWGSDFYVFREGIKPMWEDDQNVKGGRWLVMIEKQKRQQILDHYWMEMLLALVGEQFGQDGDDICGACCNVRNKGDKVALWTRDAMKDSVNYRIGQVLYKALDVKDNVMRYEAHKDASARTGSMVKPRIILSSTSQNASP